MAKKIWKAILVLLCAVLIWSVFTVVMIIAGDKILIFGYTGLENMFHPPIGCYAAVGRFHVPVPTAAVKLICPESENFNYSEYEDDRERYFVQLCYDKEGVPMWTGVEGFTLKNTVEHDHDSTYVIEYSKQGSYEHTYDAAPQEILDQMLDITEQLCDMSQKYDPATGEWNAYSGGGSGDGPDEDSHVVITSFMLTEYDDGALAVTKNEIYSYKNGKLSKVMDIPENADFDYCIRRR